MKVIIYLFLSILLLVFIFPSCSSETAEEKTYNKEMLSGRWEIISATRNGNPTLTLDSTYFIFQGDGQLSSNFNLEGIEEASDFEFAGNTIREKKTNGLSYAIDTLGSDRMVLLTQFMNFDFKLTLEKK